MLTNFDLMRNHVCSLAEKLMSGEESLLDETLYNQYCKAFEQLVQIIEKEKDTIDAEKLATLKITVTELENEYAKYQNKLSSSIKELRLKTRVNNAYTSTKTTAGYNRIY